MTAYAPTTEQARYARLCVARHVGDDETERELLAMLGLAVPAQRGGDEQGERAEACDMKRCTACEETKPRTEFYRHPKGRDGLRPQCKECELAKRRRPRELAPCGTRAAYCRHRRRGEPVDDACAEASRVHTRERRAWRTAA